MAPALDDPWLAGRHFGIVVDAGSSGSRLQIYSWRDPKTIDLSKERNTLPKVEKGSKDDKGWVYKVEPGLSSLASNPVAVGVYLKPLILHAVEEIPPSLHSSTSIFLLATAGMRLLRPEEQAAILTHTCHYLRSFNFKVDDPSETLGPCGSSVRIITGEEEGLLGWIAVNYLMDGFKSKSSGNGKEQEKETDFLRTTYGFLDMGGASTQIAFEPSVEHEDNVKGKGLVDVRLRLLSGEEIRHKVFVTTWLGYGTNQARERYVKKMIQRFEETHATAEILDPCLPKGLKLTESTTQIAGTATKPHTLTGTGSFEQCVRKTAPLLNKDSPCTDSPCPMNGTYVPPIDFSVSHFIGVSEYWYSSEHIFGLGGAYDFVQYERAAVEFCGRHWTGIEKQHEESRKKHQLGGDGEVMKDGKVAGVDLWGPKVETPRLQMQCFKAAWIVNVLHEGLGMPRIVDPEGNGTTGGAQVAEQAQQKGLGRPPTFQSVDIVNDTAISWTLGKMVLEASKEVPPIKQSSKLIVDPVDDIEGYSGVLKPIRPPFFSISMDDIEDKLVSHLPSSLTRDSLGFSPVLILIWMVVVFVLFIMIYPLRRQLKMSLLRPMRGKRDFRGESMEEGRFISENGPTAPTWRPPLWVQRLLFRSGVARDGDVHLLPHLQSFGSLNSLQTLSSENPTEATVVSSTRYTISRGPSPGPGGMVHEGQQFLTSRSRNSSQLNLEEFARRPALTIMSIDLDWLKLDASLASHVIDLLNRQLDSAERPSFIGPVQVVALDFGSNAPDVELIDLRDIYRDFLEDEDEDEHHLVKVTEGGDDDDDYEWVSRRAGVRQDPTPIGGSRQDYLPSHTRSRCHGTSGDHISPSMDPWTSGLSRPPSFSTYGMQSFSSASNEVPFYQSPSPATPFVMIPSPLHGHHTERMSQIEPESSLDEAIPPPALTTEPLNPYPNLQLHLHVNWQSNIRISIQTSLLINYPSPMFMSLPIRLSITGLVFNGEVAVAYEGRRKRVHLCILDDLDPYGPAGSRRMSNSSLNSPTSGVGTDQNTPLEPDDPIIGGSRLRIGGLSSSGPGNVALPSITPNINTSLCMTSALGLGSLGHNPTTHTRLAKPGLPIGQRLLPSIFIESEIGQADKHVLKNVTRVEKFIQDVIRKTVEEELVFPSFHTLVMGESG